jgi:hypothetical protein
MAELLTPETIAHDFGTRSAWSREVVSMLVESLPSGGDAAVRAMQSYYVAIVQLVTERLVGNRGILLSEEPPFTLAIASETENAWTQRLRSVLANDYTPASTTDAVGDLFKPLYQNLFPRALRHAQGEYYTPDWLANHVLDQLGYTGQSQQRLLDPACGSGTFLVMAIRRAQAALKKSHFYGKAISPPSTFTLPPLPPPAPHPSHLAPLSSVVGLDINPLAVLTARANWLIAWGDLLPDNGPIEIPIYLCDSILSDPLPEDMATPFDYVVGNPPWIVWDNLPVEVRKNTKPLWERYGLFSLTGNEARHGGGKKDLSMLMLYTAADRYLKLGGRLGMVLTQTAFQSRGAGDGFRRFRLGPDGLPLGVIRVDDLTAIRPFGDAANWTSTVILEKGRETEYPVAYVRWSEARREKAEGGRWKNRSEPMVIPGSASKVQISNFRLQHCLARPIDPARPGSPWLVEAADRVGGRAMRLGQADYVAHLGANSGGANGVYWVELLAKATAPSGAALVRIHNLPARGKRAVEPVECLIEPDLLYPLLRWSNVRRYRAAPRHHILLVQDVQRRIGIDETTIRECYPYTLNYLDRFRDLLTARAAYRRYQDRGAFYSMYNVGPYTIAPVKVVWRRMDRRITAAVVETVDDPILGRRPIVPQETCVLVACESTDEAHYLCAMLNSAAVSDLVAACSVRGGKGFGAPGMLDFVPIRRFRPDDQRHAELAVLSREAHEAESATHEIKRDAIQRAIDRQATKLFG